MCSFPRKALREKYLEPPKSLKEAAGRDWHPIHARTLEFNRREEKAALVESVTLDDLLIFHEAYLTPQGPKAGMLCTQIWPGKRGAGGADVQWEKAAAGGAGADAGVQGRTVSTSELVAAEEVLLLPDGLADFKQSSRVFRNSQGMGLPQTL
jgi:hypothetical protein